jgi:NTE family protein
MGHPERSAVVLSGGGANGAYEVGVLKALLAGQSPATQYQPLEPSAFATTSIGAFNACVLLSHFEGSWRAAVEVLEAVWSFMIAGSASRNGVFRIRANPLQFVDAMASPSMWTETATEFAADVAYLLQDWFTRFLELLATPIELEARIAQLFDVASWVSHEPVYALLANVMRFDRVRRSSVALSVTTTRWRNGGVELFGNSQMTDEVGPLIVLASSAIPGLFSPVVVTGEPHVDGGLVMNTPLKPAIDAGADTLHVVYLDPKPDAIPIRALANTIDTMGRIFAIAFAASVADDLRVAAQINMGIARRPRSSASTRRAQVFAAGQGQSRSGYRPLTIHLYRPRREWAGAFGMLDFRRDRLEHLIEQGFSDCADHDCQQAGCIFPMTPQ